MRIEDWFLTADERGNPAYALPDWSTGNAVVAHVHGSAYFARLVEVVSALEQDDHLFFTDWRGDSDERLTEDGPTVAELLRAAAARDVEVRALMWRSHPGRLNSEENSHLGRIINECGGEALLDERVKWGGSHHQKLFVVRHKGRPEDDVAFVGGIDLCYSRRDDADTSVSSDAARCSAASYRWRTATGSSPCSRKPREAVVSASASAT